MQGSDHDITDVAVVGAGPAGVAAAVTAARAGRTVVIVDANERTGGQFYRRPAAGLAPAEHGRPYDRWAEFEDLDRELAEYELTGRVRYLPRTTVWIVSPGPPFRVHTRGPDRDPATRIVRARQVIIATGAYDRHVPFPGWDLPGVVSCGGAQALVKGSLVAAGSRVVIAGTGPFLLPVATSLVAAGANVVAVVETNSPVKLLRRIPALVGGASKLPDLARYAAVLARHRVPYLRRHRVLAAQGTGAVERVILGRVDSSWHARPGTGRRLDCDTLAIGYGFTAQLDLLLQLGCDVVVGPDGGLAVRVDDEQRTSVPGVFAAGEATGIGGADLALVEGLLAGAAAARAVNDADPVRVRLRALKRRRSLLRRFADALHAAFPVQDGWIDDLAEDTVVCRCEEVPYAKVRDAVTDLGATDARTVKLLTRTGMGWCQGRICSYPTSILCARLNGRDASPSAEELAAATHRPVANPVPLSALADLEDCEAG